MKETKPHSNHKESRGSVLLEFAIVLPLLLVLGFGGIEYARNLNTYQVAVSLSKEIAATAYRQCVFDPTQPPTGALSSGHQSSFDAPTCLSNVRDTFTSSVASILPGAKYQIYMYQSVSGTVSSVLPINYSWKTAITPLPCVTSVKALE